MDISYLLDYDCTDKQRKIVNAVIKHGSSIKAAKALGHGDRYISRTIANLKKYAAKQGLSPEHDMNHPVPDGFSCKGVSTLYGEDGGIKGQWVKSTIDAVRQAEIMQEAISAMAETIPKAHPVTPPKKVISDLLNQYTITDYHLGMMAWHEETGEDWDTKIAEKLLLDWFAAAIKSAPDAAVGVFAQLGDFLHWDGLDAVTPANRHILDADTRFQKVVRVAIRAIRQIIQMLLKKHDQVHIIMAEGNHDMASSVWLRELFAALYENEPRITVDNSADVYYCYEHGQTCLFYHHGHKRRPANIDHVFAAKFREEFGRTKYAYAHMGHLHHVDLKETTLMVVEQHRTLSAKDAYASRGGWMSGRDAKVITYSKLHGEVARVNISPEMVQEAT